MKIQKYLSGFVVLALVAGCGAEIDSNEQAPDSGSADFSQFITVGDSLTAGYADGALYRQGQKNSYPAILARQFALAGGGDFTQPLMPKGATGKLSLTGSTEIGNLSSDRLVLDETGDPDQPFSPMTIAPTLTTSIDARVGDGGFNNLGVPGAKLYHVPFPGYGNLNPAIIDAGGANPFFARFSSDDATSVLTDALDLDPTFFVFWVGNNDILLYAVDGGVGEDRTGNPNVAGYGPEDDITDPGFFDNGFPGLLLPSYADMVALLTAGGAKGVLANVPDIRSIPYFTTVPHDPVELTAAEANELNTNPAIIGYNAAILGQVGGLIDMDEYLQRRLEWVKGFNPVLITDDELTPIPGLPSSRLATSADYILLPTSSKIGEDAGGGFLWGVSAALEDGDVLSEDEAAFVEAARQLYNDRIEATADANDDLLLFDVAATLDELNENGLFFGTGAIYSEFATGGGFSLDGVHPTARGYAVIANEIIRVINEGFGANVPLVDPGQYTTVFYQ